MDCDGPSRTRRLGRSWPSTVVVPADHAQLVPLVMVTTDAIRASVMTGSVHRLPALMNALTAPKPELTAVVIVLPVDQETHATSMRIAQV